MLIIVDEINFPPNASKYMQSSKRMQGGAIVTDVHESCDCYFLFIILTSAPCHYRKEAIDFNFF